MKNYDQMANDVLRRIEEQNALLEEKRENRRKAAPKFIAASLGCVCMVAILGVVAWQNGWISFNKGVYIPRAEIAVEQPVVSNGEKYKYDSSGTADKMYYSYETSEEIEPYIEYEGRIYRESYNSSTERGECFGKVNDGTSGVTGTVEGDVYPVEGMDPEFMLCVEEDIDDKKYDKDVPGPFCYYINDNDITLRTGKDWFVKLYKINGDISGGTYGRSDTCYYTPPRLDERELSKLNEFMKVLYDSPFVYCKDENIDAIMEETVFKLISFWTDNHLHINLTLVKGGYVLVGQTNAFPVCIKMDDPVFNEMMNMLY